MNKTRFYFNEILLLAPRILKYISDVILVATIIDSRTDDIRSSVPEPIVYYYDNLCESLKQGLEKAKKAAPPGTAFGDNVIKIEIPEVLLTIATKKELNHGQLLNWVIDRWVSSMESAVSGSLVMPETSPEGKAARLLYKQWFPTGLDFLKYEGPKQWLAVQQRFEKLSEESISALEILKLVVIANYIIKLNSHYGNLLGLTVENPYGSSEKEVVENQKVQIDNCLDIFTKLLVFSNFAWPNDNEEDNKNRERLIGPYFEKLQQIYQNRVSKNKKAKIAAENTEAKTEEKPDNYEYVPSKPE